MSKRNRNDESDNEQTKKIFTSNKESNINPQSSNKKFENDMEICYEDNEINVFSNKTAKVVIVKEISSSEILNMDFYPNLHRNITNKVGW
ncbi:hypothetical protein H8356DRAFT_952840 [Neocallimastix lanati (nom. inval.)]|nr:hypothetical protein H8356DRAFT_952840 [Neocallimastix sp. JGI-2020a]